MSKNFDTFYVNKIVSSFAFVVIFVAGEYVENFIGAFLLILMIVTVQIISGFFYNLALPSNLFNLFFVFFILVGFIFENIIRGFSPQVFEIVMHSTVVVSLTFVIFRRRCAPITNKTYVKEIAIQELMIYIMCTIGILCGLFFYLKIGNIPLLGDTSPEARIKAMKGNGILLQPLRAVPVLAMLLFITTNHKTLAFFIFLIGNVLFLGTGYRGFFVQNLLHFWLIHCLVTRKRPSLSSSFIFGIIMLSLLFGLGFIRGDGAYLGSIAYKILHAFSVSIYILEIVLEDFNDYKYGLTFFYKFSGLLPVENIEFTQWLSENLPINFNAGVTPTLIGDLYINFSIYYWLAFIIIMLFLCRLDRKMTQTVSGTTIMFISILGMGLARAMTGGLSNTLYQVTMALVVIFIVYAAGKFKVRSHEK